MKKTEKPATQRQMAYFESLQKETGGPVSKNVNELTSSEASRIIDQLIGNAQQNGAKNGQMKINEPRLGMAMKEVYRSWKRWGRGIFDDDQKRQRFIDDAIRTYDLFTEIAEKLQRNSGSVEKPIWLEAPDRVNVAEAKV